MEILALLILAPALYLFYKLVNGLRKKPPEPEPDPDRNDPQEDAP